MPTFKPKNSKKISTIVSHHFTLDTKHSQKMNEFVLNEREKIPKLKSELHKLLQKQKLLSIDSQKFDSLEISNQIRILKKEINDLHSHKIDYFLDNSKYIFEYFENKKKIEDVDIETNTQKKQNVLLQKFFNSNTDCSASAAAAAAAADSPVALGNTTIIQSYLENVDNDLVDQSIYYRKSSVCQNCFNGEMISMEDEGIMLCNKCYVVSKYLIENEKPSYREPPREVSFYAYKKINHFKEILTQFQGRESTHIPSEVIEKIKLQIKKERIQLSKITYDELKTLLKKLGYNKYYEHINFIKSKLGIPCLILPQQIEDTLCNFFMEIQYPYAKHCPDYRINFLHYYYVLYKLLQIIGQTEYLKEIPMLKDKDKLIEQDIIWKKICIDLNWEFIPTTR